MISEKLSAAQSEYYHLRNLNSVLQKLEKVATLVIDPITHAPVDCHLPLARDEFLALRKLLEQALFGEELLL